MFSTVAQKKTEDTKPEISNTKEEQKKNAFESEPTPLTSDERAISAAKLFGKRDMNAVASNPFLAGKSATSTNEESKKNLFSSTRSGEEN